MKLRYLFNVDFILFECCFTHRHDIFTYIEAVGSGIIKKNIDLRLANRQTFSICPDLDLNLGGEWRCDQ